MSRVPKLTLERLAELAQEHGYATKERTQCICHPSLGRCYDETFICVMDGEKTIAEFDVRFISGWMSEETVLWEVRRYERQCSHVKN